MIYRAIIYLSTIAPLIGVLLMEAGAFGLSINETGHPNGATGAFAAYLGVCFAVAALVTRGTFFFDRRDPVKPQVRADENFVPFGVRTLLVMLVFTVFTVYLMGGINVLTGNVGKGEFRATLGGLGAIGYLILKFWAPAVFAFAAVRFSRSRKTAAAVGIIVTTGLLLVLLAMSWGFKTGGILALLPALMILFWDAPLRKLVLLVPPALLFVIFSLWLFDARDDFDLMSALEFLFNRLTVLQGDVAWKIWDLHVSGTAFPDYATTLLVAAGDRIFSAITGITIDHQEAWVLSHFGLMLTYLSGYPIEGILAGHNVTGTPFSEGVVAGGIVGVAVFGVLSGLLVGGTYLLLRRALDRRWDKVAAITASYSVIAVMAWIVGGSIVSLFHISVVFGILSTAGLLYFLAFDTPARDS